MPRVDVGTTRHVGHILSIVAPRIVSIGNTLFLRILSLNSFDVRYLNTAMVSFGAATKFTLPPNTYAVN
eukprot:3131587-Amphidinium_carterae.1